MNRPDFEKYPDGILPAIIQDHVSGSVLMLGYMNEEAWQQTLTGGKVVFYSRSKQSLWLKGEISGNYLDVVQLFLDCDNDCLLITAKPHGPTCHTGATTCFGETVNPNFLVQLEETIEQRRLSDNADSYVASLFRKGLNKIAQKVGEEVVELVIEAKDDNKELFLNEAADLLFHYLILLKAKGHSMEDVISILKSRHKE